jgi:hypothetical protein
MENKIILSMYDFYTSKVQKDSVPTDSVPTDEQAGRQTGIYYSVPLNVCRWKTFLTFLDL